MNPTDFIVLLIFFVIKHLPPQISAIFILYHL